MGISGCSSAFDKRPIAGESAFGIPFRATLEGVYIARVAGSSETEYRDVATAAARYRFAGTDPVGITVSLLSDLATSVARATVSDTERRLASARCVYVLRPKSRTIAEGIRNTAFAADNTNIVEKERNTGDLVDDSPEGVEPESSSGEDESGLVSLLQICNSDLRLGAEVMITITSNGGTIHPGIGRASKTVGDVMRRRNLLPPEPVDSPVSAEGLPRSRTPDQDTGPT